jgi:hypothetical protein
MTRALSIGLVAALSAAPSFAQANKQKQGAKQPAPAAKAPASAPASSAAPPQISVAGIRVTGLGLGANGTELKPFNESPGTTVAIALVAPKGSGIVDIDDHASKLDAFNDDKGQSLMEEGRIGPFPHVTEDGTAALFEVEVRARPSAGAASVSVQGSVAMTLAAGSKPTRAANVKLDANATFKMGATTLTISDPKVEDEATQFTVNLPRSLLTTVRDIRFFDTKNQPIEGHRRGSGYFNEKAELELEAKTKDKVITIEFELWQNTKVVKFPFNVTAGIGMSGGASAGTASAAPADKGDKPSPSAAKADPPAKKADGPPPAIGAGDGAATPDAVIKQMQTAALAGKGAQVMSVIYPTERNDYAQGVAMALAFLPMANLNDAKASDAMTKELDAFYAKHNVKPPFARDAADLFKGVDVNAFVTDSFAFIKSHAKKGDNPADMLPVPQGKVENVKLDGDSATATLNGKDVNFSKISGKWFIHLK